MSTYLLLRNNKETGPFTIEEIKELSLKSYDLVWVVGKSAAWRYPGEIAEFKSFAPAVPEAIFPPVKKQNAENQGSDASLSKKAEPDNLNTRENASPKPSPSRSVYVNLPAEKKQAVVSAAGVLYDSGLDQNREEAYDFSDLYKKRATRTVRFSGKLVWVSTILLLFGTGILTGFFISDRRKFFSAHDKHSPKGSADPSLQQVPVKEIPPVNNGLLFSKGENLIYADSMQKTGMAVSGKHLPVTIKKIRKNTVKTDSVSAPQPADVSLRLTDSSLKQNTISKTDILYQKIKANPENYVSIVTGKYSTGIFGGISSLPLTITNNSPVMMDLVVVNIDYIQSNDKVFKTESISFNDLEPGETVTQKAPKSARGTKIAAHIRLINSHTLNLNYAKD